MGKLNDLAKKTKEQADKAAEQKRQSEAALGKVQDSQEKNKSNVRINAAQKDIEEAADVARNALIEDQKLHHESTDRLSQHLTAAQQDASIFKKSKPPAPKTPWYSAFCCCVNPVDDEERKPLLPTLKK